MCGSLLLKVFNAVLLSIVVRNFFSIDRFRSWVSLKIEIVCLFQPVIEAWVKTKNTKYESTKSFLEFQNLWSFWVFFRFLKSLKFRNSHDALRILRKEICVDTYIGHHVRNVRPENQNKACFSFLMTWERRNQKKK